MQNKGFVALSTILLITAIVGAVVSTVTYLAIGEGQAGLAAAKGEEELALVEGCVEDVLLKFHDNANYNGTSISWAGIATCNINIVSGAPNYDVKVTVTPVAAAVGEYKRQIEVKFTRGSAITLTSWQEI